MKLVSCADYAKLPLKHTNVVVDVVNYECNTKSPYLNNLISEAASEASAIRLNIKLGHSSILDQH